MQKLWHCKEAILKVPNLAIHLSEKRDVFEPNKENHTKPILASAIVDQIMGEEIEKLAEDKYKVEERHFKTLLERISNDLGIERSQIVDFELNVLDA